MNQGRIWCVVNPSIGLPLFLVGVAATSLIVHASVMTHTTWVGGFWQGKSAKTAMVEPAAEQGKLALATVQK
jgi:light-harvesting protein B-800-850 alpha chain